MFRNRFNLNVALPTVFDESLSWYECLGKLSAKIDAMMEFINNNIRSYIVEAISSLVTELVYHEEDESIVIVIKGGETNE